MVFARTVLYTGLVQELGQLLVEEGDVRFLTFFGRYVNIADAGRL